ncbi:ABC transporter substrate-binding protein [Paenibacillus sp. IB182496]|uniref:ABC transporter substrate-binding protein n=1 Tax=Paenibacillus sabuli TaxID=2772509 RepID=A0A927GR95_9BACL|nr:ABC transporter substrate-binding protein [Paenibacillus sabuli]MBD2845384.1 ABC transporter substrate-binding protein [Paenibacillus sabuli]
MKHNRLVKGSVLLLALLLVLAGCGNAANDTNNEGNTNSNANANAGQNDGAAQEGQERVLTIANPADIQSFDFHNNNTTVSESVLVNMYDYLIQRGADMELEPNLATSWERVDDTTWAFELRDDVTFHNGDPFTAADVKYTLERIATDEALKQHSLYNNIEEVTIIDDTHVEIHTINPDPILLNRLSRMGAGMLPSKYIEENGIDAFLAAPVGTGPYKYGSWAKDDRVELVKNDDYFGGEPQWDKVVFRAIPETSTRVSELLTGGVDIIANVPSTDIPRIDLSEGTSIVSSPIQRVLQVILRHTEGSPTADPKVREALDLAIDKQGIVDSIAGGAGTVTRTSVTPGNFGADPSLYEQTLYDADRAKQLMEEAGYSADNPAVVSLSAQSQYKEYAEVVAAMLTDAYFEVNLEILESSAFSEKLSSRTFGDLFMIGIGNSLFDASNNYNRFTVERNTGETDYDNSRVEELLQDALQNMDEASRTEQYQEVQQIFAEERPAVYLFQMEGIYGKRDAVNFDPRIDEMFYAEEITSAE